MIPKVSLIMSSFNRYQLLELGLKSIVRYKPSFPLEIVVVNDGDNDETESICKKYEKFLRIKYIFTGQRHAFELVMRNPAIPNNVAIKQASGDIVILTNPEILHLNGAIDLIIAPLLKNKKLMSIPEGIYFDNTGDYTNGLLKRKDIPLTSLKYDKRAPMMPYLFGIWKSELEAIGGYDEELIGYGSDDNDLCERLESNGCKYYTVKASAVHLYHGKVTIDSAIYDNPAWMYNRRLMLARKDQIIRNVGKEWGTNVNPVSNKITNLLTPVFEDIYKNRLWNSDETVSGTGSELRATKQIRKQIPTLFEKYKIKRVLDVGCGDCNWMKELFGDFEYYLGLDVVPELIASNKKKFGTKNIEFLCEEVQNLELQFYNFDVVIFSDVLVHLSFFDIDAILYKLKRSGIHYILMTQYDKHRENIDITSGQWRPIKWDVRPFSFGAPIHSIPIVDEIDQEIRKDTDKSLSLWELTKMGRGFPKICHLYWDKSPMAWLQTQTVVTFHEQNPDWEIKVYVPLYPPVPANDKYVPDYKGPDYFNIVRSLPYVKIIDIDSLSFGIDKNIHNILQSDIFRYKILYEEGGVWSDFDVLWIKPVSHLFNLKSVGRVETKDMGTFVCRWKTTTGHNNISILGTRPRHPLYRELIKQCRYIQNTNRNREELSHQVFGTELLDDMFPTLDHTCRKFPDVVGLPYKTLYPYSIYEMDQLYKKINLALIDNEVVAIHWFNGHKLSKDFLHSGGKHEVCSMTKLISNLKLVQPPKISVVMAYYNRRDQLIHTLKSISKTAYSAFEVILIDDDSRDDQKVNDLIVEFPFLKVFRIKKIDKWWLNPCIPYNMGFAIADGEIIIIQNPECFHTQDVISYMAEHLNNQTYISASCYALDEESSKNIESIDIHKLNQEAFHDKGQGWYNHPTIHPVHFHFCAGITRSNLQKLGGFDERFAQGIAFDDTEFVERVKRLGLGRIIPKDLLVIHQWHSKAEHFYVKNYKGLWRRNKALYDFLTLKETSVFKENSYV